jgi:5-formyltetrahydrofolate cyclo-ligase
LPGTQSHKATIRQILEGIRYGLPASYRAHASRTIVARLLEIPELSDADEVHCYMPVVGTSEVDTRPLIEAILAGGSRVYLPVISSFEGRPGAVRRIHEAEYNKTISLRKNRWGIDEPVESAPRLFGSEVAVVPGLGAGRNGIRVGHGWGYYDELLDNARVPVLFPCYDACVVDFIEGFPTDVRVSQIVTESQIIAIEGVFL